jgi:hypothetical protein
MRGIIIIGNCRSGKQAMIQQLLKERPVLLGIDFGDMTSAVLSLNMSFEKSIIASKKLNDAMLEFQKITPDKIVSMNDYFRDEAMKLRSFQENENTIVYEKVQSKFISRPINNFRKR